jgi:hypothetical protein
VLKSRDNGVFIVALLSCCNLIWTVWDWVLEVGLLL